MTVLDILNTGISRFYELLIMPGKDTSILWTIAPLLIVTIIMFTYFVKHENEELGWNSAVANSLVALFVSISLLNHIYSIALPGSILNFTQYLSRTVLSLLLFFTGFVLLMVNFQHILPKKAAFYVSSPLTMNLISYIVIIFVYSTMPFDWITLIVLIMIFITLRILLHFVKLPLVKLFGYFKRLKEQEKIKDLEKEKKNIKDEKKQIKKKEKKLKETKVKEIKQEEKQIKKIKKELKKK